MRESPGETRGGKGGLAFRIYRWEGFIFNGLCAVYFLLFAPGVVAAADAAMRDPEARVIWLGLLLAAITIGETWAFPVKIRFVLQAIRDQGDSGGRAFYLWMFHTVISIVLLLLIAGSFGVKIGEAEDAGMPEWLGGLVLITVIKELVLLGFLFLGGGSDGEAISEGNPKYVRPRVREWVADAILVVYACVAYSATWGAITRGMSLEPENPPMFVLNLFVSSLLFLIFYLPLRIPYWIEEMAQVRTRGDALRLVGSILVVLVPAIAMLV